MQKLADSLPKPNVPTAQPMRPSQKSSPQRLAQLKALLVQSYDVFQIYGKEPEAIKNQLLAFSTVLESHAIEDITAAFTEWLRISAVFPTPADILKLTVAAANERTGRRNYRPRPPPRKPAENAVSWCGLMWNQFTDRHKADLVEHLKTMTLEKAKAYLWYLHEFCGAPQPERMFINHQRGVENGEQVADTDEEIPEGEGAVAVAAAASDQHGTADSSR
jgi:hypothetical protein